MTSLLDTLRILEESDWRAREQRRAAESLAQALATEERRKAELLADALARRLEPAPAEPEPPPAEPAPAEEPPRKVKIPTREIEARLKAGASMIAIRRETGESIKQIRKIRDAAGIPKATPGPKPRVE